MTTLSRNHATWDRLKVAANHAGRKLSWVTAQMGWRAETLRYKINGQPGYAPLSPLEMARLAELLETTVEELWPTSVTDDDSEE